MRWQLADEPSPQQPLFEGLVSREVGRGEFRGMEFLHVEAKRIINEVPPASQVPFRHTINVYRGCSHACTYCLAGETPILMADGTTRPVAEVAAGDRVYGTEVRGAYRRYVTTEVLDHWSTVKTAYRVALEDGTELVTSPDHRFLTNRGWKHVTGAEQGRARRPHITTANKLMGTGRFARTPPATRDYRVGYLTGLIRGDAHPFRLALDDSEALSRSRVFLAAEGIETEELGNAVRAVVAWPIAPSEEWRRGFLAGIFDGAGSASDALRIATSDPALLALTAGSLSALGFRYAVEGERVSSGGRNLRLLGGLRERLRFFHTVDPAVTSKRVIPEGTALKGDAKLRVVAVEPLGVEMPMYDLTTGTGDFVADGVVSHNCFARPTHEYLDLDSWRDFERRIVVKVNAVERLRAELHPKRWAGEHIAMGTNTDPYQRCEGKYHLTRGVVEALSEVGNPFSILTKSSLVVRDVDLLAEASRRTDVSVNFSVGTLDDDVWKLTEPGTPHPLRRVEALARLHEAGIRTGAMIAPIIPGLSDEPDLIDRVVGACLAAGARVVSPIVLHLRPGVRQLFMPWLEEHRPDLLARYRRLYRDRSYSPKEYQREVARMVAEAVERHGGISGGEPRRGPRGLTPPPAPGSADVVPDRQLPLPLGPTGRTPPPRRA